MGPTSIVVPPKTDPIIINIARDHLGEDRAQALAARFAESEEVHIACRPMCVPGPDREQGRALEQEEAGVLRLCQSVEQALVGVPREEQLKVIAALLRELK